jgi:hypothetical protein
MHLEELFAPHTSVIVLTTTKNYPQGNTLGFHSLLKELMLG